MSQDPITIYNTGWSYFTGSNGYPLDQMKAMTYFQKAADLGFAPAMNYMGIIYEQGNVVPKDLSAAVDWYQRALQANPNNFHASYNLGRICYDLKQYDRSFQLLDKAVELGANKPDKIYARASYIAGTILLENYKDEKRSYPYFVKAAVHGNIAEAWHNLGYLAEKGVVPPKDPSENDQASRDGMAREFYETAAGLGFVPSMDALGRLYIGYQKIEQGKMWLKRAAAKGYEPSKKKLKILRFGGL